jgi:hypothetical protein
MYRTTLTALVVALTAAFLGSACRAGEGGTPGTLPPPPPKEKTPWEKVGEVAVRVWRQRDKVAGRLKGRILGSLIHEGMCLKQVKQILGEAPPGSTHFLGLVGDRKYLRIHVYDDLGLLVSTTEQAGVRQVSQPVEFDPLLD